MSKTQNTTRRKSYCPHCRKFQLFMFFQKGGKACVKCQFSVWRRPKQEN